MRPVSQLPETVVQYAFPIVFENRREHDAALRATGLPYLRFGETLDPAIGRASDDARRDALCLSDSVMRLPVHHDLDERQIDEYPSVLLDYAERLRPPRLQPRWTPGISPQRPLDERD